MADVIYLAKRSAVATAQRELLVPANLHYSQTNGLLTLGLFKLPVAFAWEPLNEALLEHFRKVYGQKPGLDQAGAWSGGYWVSLDSLLSDPKLPSLSPQEFERYFKQQFPNTLFVSTPMSDWGIQKLCFEFTRAIREQRGRSLLAAT